jgi:hypothetical protein
MIKRVVEFFPTWSDIRKRYDKSTGGLFLGSIVEETMNIEQALKEYKDFYFLDKYEGHEDEVVAFTYMANIGKIENLSLLNINYNNSQLVTTTDIESFLESHNLAYYEDGKIYLREELIISDKKIELEYDGYTSSYELNKTHIWNIFDEFACFVGLKRQELESNEDLQKRILYTTKNLPNGSVDGLKNAIIAELLTIEPNIDFDDIVIEKVTPDNLNKPYESFNSLLDMLSEINRDVYKNKRWDLDEWQYDFKSIQYMDNKWNEVINTWQNGIGYDTDLKVVVSSAVSKTDANVTLYKKSEERLLAYIHNKNINKNIKFKLRRYNNIMNSLNVKYRIKASEALDITNEDIELSIYEDDNKTEKRYIQDVFKFGSGVTPIDKSKITDSKKYKLEFVPGKENNNMEISKCRVVYKHKYTKEIVQTTNLLKQAPGFMLNAEGSLINTSIKKSVKSINNFNTYDGLIDSSNGITLAPNRNSGSGSVSVSGLGMNFVKIDQSYNLSNVPKDVIKLNQFAFWKDNLVHFRYDIPQERTLNINIEANVLEFDILDECSLDLFVNIDGESKYQKISGPMTFKTDVSNKPRKMDIRLISMENKAIRIGNFKYSSHEINCKLQFGSLLTTADGQIMLPNFAQNSLIVDVKSNSGSQPVIKGIYVGADISKSIFRTELISHIADCDRIFEVSSNCQINLLEVDSFGTPIKTTENYEPITAYRADKDDAWIRLNTDEYSTIKNLTATLGAVELISESGKTYYNIKLKNGDIVSSFTITGVKSTPVRIISLTEMIKTAIPTFDITKDKVYCSKNSDGLIIAKSDPDAPYIMILQLKSILFAGINASKYKFTKLPEYLGVTFGDSMKQTQGYETTTKFDYIGFYPANAVIYQAINEYNMILNEARGIKILNNFSPTLQQSVMLFYTIEAMNSSEVSAEVNFCTIYDKDKSFNLLQNWSLGNKDIAIKLNTDISNVDLYDVTEHDISDEVLLSKYVNVKNSYQLSTNSIVYTDRCVVIPPNGMHVEYETYKGEELSTLVKSEEFIIEEDGFNKL